ncbi:hypothetical protein [Verrucosispora sioxanthis]|uniref:Uncharacterized protein n=1 Tax=Verrucosispora sioxanthis TaxID=2499994 RepID=A0A6M1LB43_9ACTN|nr:hypothetical protein [Verrucosispora sioxanthis]NEE66362.1 hypothetical protein [Verrucosispora sioxanthis]NGM15472.1 hypothetical protein [Verrucosispora sioxanthis]
MAVVVDLLNVTIILHGLLKVTAITNAIRWISERGRDYRLAYDRMPPADDAAKLRLLDECGGTFFPFGAKDHRIRRRYLRWQRRSRRWRAAAVALRLWATVCFTAPGLVALTVLSTAGPAFFLPRPPGARWLTLGAALVAAAIVIAMFFEALTWYLTVRGYARRFLTTGFHRTRVDSTGENLAELRIYIYLAASMVLANSMLCLTAAVSFGSYRYLDGSAVGYGPSAVAAACLHTASSMSFLGESPFTTHNSVGSLIGVLDLGSGVMLILFGLTLLPAILNLSGRTE